MTTTMTVARGALAWLNRQSAPLLLAATTAGLAGGGLAYLAGAGGAADLAWLATAACGLGYALWIAVASLRRGRLSVDVIALLALAGAVAVGELLAAAVISVMLASGRALEAWAAHRARHDLSALLARAPRAARRYRDGSLETVPLRSASPRRCSTGRASPVSADSSRTAAPEVSVPSTGMTSPAATSSRSPAAT